MATVSSRMLRDSMTSRTKAVPRSNENVTMATRQPSFSAPTRAVTGTRTSSRISSPNSLLPMAVRSGRTRTPRVSIGRISQVMPWCLDTPGSVRTRSSQWSATSACEVHSCVR